MLRFFLCVFFGVSSFMYAEEDLIASVLENYPDLVVSYEEGKLYIKPEHIQMREEGLFLQASPEKEISLPYLGSDAQGFYLSPAAEEMVKTTGTFIKIPIKKVCNNCGFEYSLSFWRYRCPNCKTPAF